MRGFVVKTKMEQTMVKHTATVTNLEQKKSNSNPLLNLQLPSMTVWQSLIKDQIYCRIPKILASDVHMWVEQIVLVEGFHKGM